MEKVEKTNLFDVQRREGKVEEPVEPAALSLLLVALKTGIQFYKKDTFFETNFSDRATLDPILKTESSVALHNCPFSNFFCRFIGKFPVSHLVRHRLRFGVDRDQAEDAGHRHQAPEHVLV